MSQTLALQAARMFTVGFYGKTLSDELKALLDRGVGGVVFFARNVGSPEEVVALTAEIKRYAKHPVFVCLDQEGGLVARLRQGFTHLPPMRALGATGDAELARRAGMLTGRELRAVGVDVNFAPILDVDTNPDNPIIGNRSFSRDAQVVADMATAFALGLQSVGVAACGKHFPGHGDTNQDSHHELPRLPHALGRLERVELLPFRVAFHAGIASVMTAHVIFEPLDDHYPATMSEPVLNGLLRKKMGYDGVVFTDDVEMKAIADHYGYEEAVTLGALAGVDNFLVCHTSEVAHRMIDTIVRGVESGRIAQGAVDTANRRLERFVKAYAQPALEQADLSVLRRADHLALLETLQKSVDAKLLDAGVDPTEAMEQIRIEQQRQQQS